MRVRIKTGKLTASSNPKKAKLYKNSNIIVKYIERLSGNLIIKTIKS